MNRLACCYEICVAEPLEDRWQSWFPEMEIVTAAVGTLLRGALPDQAALFGVLARVRDLNLTLLEVRRVVDVPGSLEQTG